MLGHCHHSLYPHAQKTRAPGPVLSCQCPKRPPGCSPLRTKGCAQAEPSARCVLLCPPCRLHASEDREPTDPSQSSQACLLLRVLGARMLLLQGAQRPQPPSQLPACSPSRGAHMQLPSTLQTSWGDTLDSHLQGSLSSEKLVSAPRFTTTRDTLIKVLLDVVL